MPESLYTIIFTPVFADWETIYRQNNGEVPLKKCWLQSKNLIFDQIVINFIQQILLCLPLMLFKVAIDKRNEDMTVVGFHPLKDELFSNQMVNDLLIAGLSVSCILPLLQSALIFLYFTKGHPWSRIITANCKCTCSCSCTAA
jgi:hypothetical protein